jgi:hypothetical protein
MCVPTHVQSRSPGHQLHNSSSSPASNKLFVSHLVTHTSNISPPTNATTTPSVAGVRGTRCICNHLRNPSASALTLLCRAPFQRFFLLPTVPHPSHNKSRGREGGRGLQREAIRMHRHAVRPGAWGSSWHNSSSSLSLPKSAHW